MVKVRFEDGTVINFEGEPSPQDIEEAYGQVKGVSQVPQQSIQEQPSKKLDVVDILNRLARGAYYNVPFGRRVGQIASSVGLADPEKIYGAMGQGQTFPERLAENVGAVAPDLLMASPFMRVAGAIPKIPPIIKSALGFGAYGGTKAALQGQPIVPSALTSAGQAALYHGAGKLGATAMPKVVPGAERIGSALGGGVAGGLTGGEEGMAMGAGFGAMFPAKRGEPQEPMAKFFEQRIRNLIKPRAIQYKFGKNPIKAIVREGAFGWNLEGLKEQVNRKIQELEFAKNQIKLDAKNKGVTVDLSANKSLEPIMKLRVELQKAPESHKALINQLDNFLKDLSSGKWADKTKLTLDDAYEFRDILKKLRPKIWTTQAEQEVADALSESYHKIVEQINFSVKDLLLKQVNKRMSDLISAEESIQYRIDHPVATNFLKRSIPFGIGWAIGQYPGAMVGGALGETLRTPGFKTGASKLLSKKYLSIPEKYRFKEQ